VNAFKDHEFDFVLMDVQMPIMDGYEATKTINYAQRQRESSKRVPIIGLTANADSKTREECLVAGMSDVLSKPVHMDSLKQLLKTIRLSKRSESDPRIRKLSINVKPRPSIFENFPPRMSPLPSPRGKKSD
jgi:CheY-like chemotaxis protein